MRQPKCEVCGDTDVQTLQFADYAPLPGGEKGHPRGLGYFCRRHARAAAGYSDLTLGQAIPKISAAGPDPIGPPPSSS